jgi:transposase
MPVKENRGGKRLPSIKLKKSDAARLKSVLNKGVHSSRLIKRARVLELLSQGKGIAEIHEIMGVYAPMIRRVGWRYIEGGLDAALNERPRPGAARKLDASGAARVVAMVCADPPEGRSRWTVRLLAEEAKAAAIVVSIGKETIRRTLKEHDLKPWREKNVVRPKIGQRVR